MTSNRDLLYNFKIIKFKSIVKTIVSKTFPRSLNQYRVIGAIDTEERQKSIKHMNLENY